MLIGELVEKTGMSRDTIRYYEKLGLLQLNKKERRENNYKEYSEEDLKKLLFIQLGKDYGFTLMEIKQFVTDKETFKQLRVIVTVKINQIEEKVNELQETQKKLQALLDSL